MYFFLPKIPKFIWIIRLFIIGGITELSRPGFSIKPSFWGSFEKLRLGFELLMFYYVEPSSVFLKPSFY